MYVVSGKIRVPTISSEPDRERAAGATILSVSWSTLLPVFLSAPFYLISSAGYRFRARTLERYVGLFPSTFLYFSVETGLWVASTFIHFIFIH